MPESMGAGREVAALRANETQEGDQPRFERGREGMNPDACPVGGPAAERQSPSSATDAEQAHGLAAGASDKRFATLQARAAQAGFALHADKRGAYYATRWWQVREFRSGLDGVERWLELVTGRWA